MVAPAVPWLRLHWESLRAGPRIPRLAWHVPGRRGLQICLGLVWLVDAALQFQPYMFGPFFVTQSIESASAGNPAIVASSMTWASDVMLHHIAIYNAVFAAIQLLIALGILWRRTGLSGSLRSPAPPRPKESPGREDLSGPPQPGDREACSRSLKPALAASVVWALFVWWFGEGLGGILVGSSPLMGVPGAVILYALIAILLWPTDRPQWRRPLSPAASGPVGARAANLLWLILWGSFSYYLLVPGNRTPDAISGIFSVTDGQPRWITSLMNGLSSLAGQRGIEISVVLAVLCAFAAIGVFSVTVIRPALILAMALGLLFWAAEGFGGIFTGQGTDPNTGPILILLAACYWPARGPGNPTAFAGDTADRS